MSKVFHRHCTLCEAQCALDRAAAGLDGVRKKNGADSIGCYIGNPIIHNYGALLLRQGSPVFASLMLP